MKNALEKSTLDPTLMELIYLRISQMNGCAFCLEMHSKALRKAGVNQAKLAMPPLPRCVHQQR